MPTIAISLKVHDGVVLAADSASTLADQQGNVLKIYNNADKIFRLHEGLPIGAVTWGLGGIGLASISTLAKDLRKCFDGKDRDHTDWEIDPDDYSMENVAKRAREFLFEETYVEVFGADEDEKKPSLGFIVAGYSSQSTIPEEWRIAINKGICEDPSLVRPAEAAGVTWGGDPEPVTRLIMGYGTMLPKVLVELGIEEAQVGPAMEQISARLSAPLVNAAMPIKDAVELAIFLADVTIQFNRFAPGPETVGGSVQAAAITKHEGFRWVKRKLYFEE